MDNPSRLMTLVVAVAMCGGCVVLDGKVRYEDLNQLVHHATGKHLHVPITEDDLALLEEKTWGADLGDLVRITDETKQLVDKAELPTGAETLTEQQRRQVRINLETALERVLLRVTDMRMLKAKRDIARGGCKSSEARSSDGTPAC